MPIEEIMQVLTVVAILLVFYWTHRSFPPNETAELIKELSLMTSKTDTELDDAIVDILDYINSIRSAGQPEGQPPAGQPED